MRASCHNCGAPRTSPMIKEYKAIYRDASGQDQELDLLAQDVRGAVSGAAELIPTDATLVRVFANPDWN